jgi:hypothetical protein
MAGALLKGGGSDGQRASSATMIGDELERDGVQHTAPDQGGSALSMTFRAWLKGCPGLWGRATLGEGRIAARV